MLGRCPRCEGELEFTEPPPAAAQGSGQGSEGSGSGELEPWQVLGLPTSWSEPAGASKRFKVRSEPREGDSAKTKP